MGFNTTVFIINDGFDQIEKHPEDFVAGIKQAMYEGGTVGVGCHVNCVEVLNTQHADVFRLYASQANSIFELSPYSVRTRKLAERMPHLVRDYIASARQLLDQLEDELPPEP